SGKSLQPAPEFTAHVGRDQGAQGFPHQVLAALVEEVDRRAVRLEDLAAGVGDQVGRIGPLEEFEVVLSRVRQVVDARLESQPGGPEFVHRLRHPFISPASSIRACAGKNYPFPIGLRASARSDYARRGGTGAPLKIIHASSRRCESAFWGSDTSGP